MSRRATPTKYSSLGTWCKKVHLRTHLLMHHINNRHSWVQASIFISDRDDEAVGPKDGGKTLTKVSNDMSKAFLISSVQLC